MMKKLFLFHLCLFILLSGFSQQPAFQKEYTPEMLKMNRHEMTFNDAQVLLFNGRGFVNPRQNSITGFGNIRFFPIEIPDYDFYFDIYDDESGTTIRDDVPAMWKNYLEKGTDFDPLGSNFRPNSPMLIVTQEDVWQPNMDYRIGIFNKKIKDRWVSFSLKSWTSVSGTKDEIYMKVQFFNRSDKPLKLSLRPHQKAQKLNYPNQKGSDAARAINPFVLASDQLKISVCGDVKNKSDSAYHFTIQPKQSFEGNFAIIPTPANQPQPDLYIDDIANRIQQSDMFNRKRLQAMADSLPVLKTGNKQIDDFYRRCILTVSNCKYERDNFIINPFWTVGTWPFTISWDNSFASDMIAMVDPQSLKETLKLNFREGKMKRTYISWSGAHWDLFYLMEPFCQQIMINSYIKKTGDWSILNEMAGDATIYEWMKRWVKEYYDKYRRKEDGLIDIGFSTETMIEIRTDGYNQVVPVINGLMIDLCHNLTEWSKHVGEDKEVGKYLKWADQIHTNMDSKLWNNEAGWYENLYPDKTKALVWSYHLYDLLKSPYLDEYKRSRLTGHIREGVFLGKYGMYSIAKTDSLHWDRIDADWGGGGQYMGMPLRVARNLYSNGESSLGWDILKRVARYTEFFPYLPQNPQTDIATQDQSSMPIQISAGAGVEVIIFGVFGVDISPDGTLVINPVYHSEIGNANLLDYHFRNNSYDIEVDAESFTVRKNGKLLAKQGLGSKLIIKG